MRNHAREDDRRPIAKRKHGPGRFKGTHALRKRCPRCKNLRRFREPPGDIIAVRARALSWGKVAGRWVCPRCKEN